MKKKHILILSLILALTQTVLADSRDSSDPDIIQVNVSPKTEPVPALKYSFLANPVPAKKGNAALEYMQAAYWRQKVPELKFDYETADSELAEIVIAEYKNAFICVDYANDMSYCDWQLHFEEGWSVLITGLIDYKYINKALALKAKVETANGDYSSAIETIRSSLIFSENVAGGPTVIQGLVGYSMAVVMYNAIFEMVEKTDSPSLYWALCEHYNSLSDMTRSVMSDNVLNDVTIKQWLQKDMFTDIFTDQDIYDAICNMLKNGFDGEGLDRIVTYQKFLQEVNGLYPQAKEYLSDNNFDMSTFDGFAKSQIVMIYKWQQYIEMRDNMAKWFSLPYYLAHSNVERIGQQIEDYGAMEKGSISFFGMFQPNFAKYYMYIARQKNILEVQICIEAIRLHLGQTGQLPESLSDITVVPTLPNTFTGKPLRYELKDKTHAAVYTDDPLKPQTYELTIN